MLRARTLQDTSQRALRSRFSSEYKNDDLNFFLQISETRMQWLKKCARATRQRTGLRNQYDGVAPTAPPLDPNAISIPNKPCSVDDSPRLILVGRTVPDPVSMLHDTVLEHELRDTSVIRCLEHVL